MGHSHVNRPARLAQPGHASRQTAGPRLNAGRSQAALPDWHSTDGILQLQRQAGNRAVSEVLARTPAPKAERARAGQAGQVNPWLNAIQKLTELRVEAWATTAHSRESAPGQAILEALIPIVSLGIGGVAYGIIEGMISKKVGHLMEEFVLLAGLEAADLAAEAVFHRVMRETKDDLSKGTHKALSAVKTTSRTALATTGGDIIDVYAEAVKLQSVQEYVDQSTVFNESTADMSDKDLAARSAALKITYDQLMQDPSGIMRELTVGFIRLLDEINVSDKAEDYHDNPAEARQQDDDLHQTGMRQGNIMVFPWPRGHSLGKWGTPNLNFSTLNATAVGINNASLERIRGAKIKDLPVTIGFRFSAASPYYRIWSGDMGRVEIWFSRYPDGSIHVGSDSEEDGREWLGSYYTGLSREFSDQERFMYALLGAQQLYDRIADTTVGRINEDP